MDADGDQVDAFEEQLRAASLAPWTPLAPDSSLQSLKARHGALLAARLEQYEAALDEPRRRGPLSRAIVRISRLLLFRLMGPYLHTERALMAALVEHEQALTSRFEKLLEAITERQSLQARNDARLAAWLIDHS
ncbi:MAG: hypothetical protein ACYDD4_09600 [Acidimicrobiales bacterium]